RLSAQRCAVVTAYPSVASAVQFTRMGFAGYLVKPASPEAVLSAVAGTPEPAEAADVSDLEWPSLDRTIWEYLNQVHAWAGSLSAAARHLRIDRRSLRRMLAKYPPVR
ncbi:MAG TPA: two-component system response regulator, partial [Polyangia bacterium]|nr:two-component system response regulator [Polyangia bacterium]